VRWYKQNISDTFSLSVWMSRHQKYSQFSFFALHFKHYNNWLAVQNLSCKHSFFLEYYYNVTSQTFPAFFRTRIVIILLTTARSLSLLSQINPVTKFYSIFLKIYFNIVLQCSAWSPEVASVFLHQNTAYSSPRPHSCYMSRSSDPPPFHNFIQSVVTSLLGPSKFFSSLFHWNSLA
jgi:hypothetical protein